MRRFVGRAAGPISERALADVELAVTEACTNVILHSGSPTMRVLAHSTGASIVVEVEDQGVFRSTTPVPEVGLWGHRGLMLITSTMDEVSIGRGTMDRPGTVVRMRRRTA